MVIITFVYATYFTKGIARDEIAGTAEWGWAMSASGVAIALISPVLGAIADAGGRRKPWLLAFTVIAVIGCWLLWYGRPTPEVALAILAIAALTNLAFEVAGVFYNAMLPEIVSREYIGRLSGWAWALGYAGGLVCLLIVLYGFVEAEQPPFGLDQAQAEDVRVSGPLVGLWLAVFSLPLFLFTPDRPSLRLPMGEAVRRGLGQLRQTFAHLGKYREIARFLIARMIYTDGLNTLFAFGGIYAAGTFGMAMAEVIKFGILLNVTAGLGALAFGWVDDWLGAKRTILIALVGLLACGTAAVVATDPAILLDRRRAARHLRRPGSGGESLADGADGPAGGADRDVRPLRADRQDHGLHRAVPSGHGDLLDRQPALGDRDDPGILRGRRPASAAARGAADRRRCGGLEADAGAELQDLPGDGAGMVIDAIVLVHHHTVGWHQRQARGRVDVDADLAIERRRIARAALLRGAAEMQVEEVHRELARRPLLLVERGRGPVRLAAGSRGIRLQGSERQSEAEMRVDVYRCLGDRRRLVRRTWLGRQAGA